MRLARIERRGRVERARVVEGGYIVETGPEAGAEVPTAEATLLCPVEPTKIVAVGWNFSEHIREMTDRLPRDTMPRIPEEPIIFLKPPSSLVGHGQPIVYPSDASRVEYEGELVAVIGTRIRRVDPDAALRAVLGWSCGNDVTERTFQRLDKQWWRAKGYDTFAVVGPHLETEAPPPEARIRTLVNGEVRQEGRVGDMLRSPAEIIAFVSRAMTLYPGDVIMLGTPPGVGELHPGDEVTVSIDGVGVLRSPVVAEPS